MNDSILTWFVSVLSVGGSLMGGAMWVGRLQARIKSLEDGLEECTDKHDRAVEHNTELVQRMTGLETKVTNIDRNVEKLVNRAMGE